MHIILTSLSSWCQNLSIVFSHSTWIFLVLGAMSNFQLFPGLFGIIIRLWAFDKYFYYVCLH